MKTKVLGLLIVVLIISSYFFLSGSSALPVTHTPVVYQSFNPFATPTPTPSPTPEPTVTPVPTPRPEPTAKPNLEIACRSTTASNLKVEVTGTLTYNKSAIPDASIYVGYSADSGIEWVNFSLVKTQADGRFRTAWTPNELGNYLICAQWEGNDTLRWMNATVNLAVTADSAGNVFSVASNSTISKVAYNSTTQILSFKTNGTSTSAYMYACIPKALVGDVQTLGVTIDGNPITFTSESQDDVWVISCIYTQSEHVFSIQIPFMQILSPVTTPWISIVIVVAMLIAIVAVLLVVRRRRRTAATVASILKENRPLY